MKTALLTLVKFMPIIIFALLVVMAGYDILVAGMICTFLTIFMAMALTKKGFSEVFECGMENTKKSTLVFFVIMFAYALAEVFLATGVGASLINIALSLGITAKSIALIAFLVTCALSVAIGTSWGTFAACAPVFLWLNYIVGGNIILTLGSVVGGCCFGDNIGLISDTTILSSGLQGVAITDRIRHQGVWSLGCLVLTSIVILVISMKLPGQAANAIEAIDMITPDVWATLEAERPAAVLLLDQVKAGVPAYMALPVVIVIVTALAKVSTMACLGSGMLSALVLGFIAGTIPDFNTFFNVYIFDGMASAGGWAIILIMWITAMSGILSSMNAFEPISWLILKVSTKVRHMMTCNALLCLFANATFADELAMIATISPITKDITDTHVEGSEEDVYKLRLRNSTFADALGVYGSQFIPWHSCVVFYLSITNAIYPLRTFGFMDVFQMNYMAIIAVVSMLVLTATGLDRFVPLMRLPVEPAVRLKKHATAPESEAEAQ